MRRLCPCNIWRVDLIRFFNRISKQEGERSVLLIQAKADDEEKDEPASEEDKEEDMGPGY